MNVAGEFGAYKSRSAGQSRRSISTNLSTIAAADENQVQWYVNTEIVCTENLLCSNSQTIYHATPLSLNRNYVNYFLHKSHCFYFPHCSLFYERRLTCVVCWFLHWTISILRSISFFLWSHIKFVPKLVPLLSIFTQYWLPWHPYNTALHYLRVSCE